MEIAREREGRFIGEERQGIKSMHGCLLLEDQTEPPTIQKVEISDLRKS
jgi:hypothetical protein